MCVKYVLQGFIYFFKGQCVKWYIDNKGVVIIVKFGSNKVYLYKLVMEIFFFFKEYDIVIDMEWIFWLDNEVVDYLSKIVDFDDWGVKDFYFYMFNFIWGLFIVDCFVNFVNVKVFRFYLLFF